MTRLIGRANEISRLRAIAESPKPEFLGVYGRRRVGKTFLIKEFFKPIAEINFYVMGMKDGNKTTQLALFQKQLEAVFFQSSKIPQVKSWNEAFEILANRIKIEHKRTSPKNILIFLDEIPWLSTPKSGLLAALDHYWNVELREIPSIRLIVCGSAASWMIKNIIHAKGGLHNRLTGSMKLLPFNIKETKEFLEDKEIHLPDRQIVDIYMAIGGVPYYLDLLRKGFSATQNIGNLCFGTGELVSEYQKLFSSLFEDSGNHLRIIKTLSGKTNGMSRKELVQKTKLPSGGKLTLWLEELEEAGFIQKFIPYPQKGKDAYFRIIDEYVWFYLRWIAKAPKGIFSGSGIDYWSLQAQTPSYKSWAGYSFENFCLKHHSAIKKALGFSAVATQIGSWRIAPPKKSSKQEGAQIDLLFDRADQVITICEIKYYQGPFLISKKYYEELKSKKQIFSQNLKTKKAIFLALITTEDLVRNNYEQEIVANSLTLLDILKAVE